MTSLNKILRQMIVVICGLCCLGNMPGMTALAAAALMHGGHEVETVEHDGHRDLILLHRDATHAEACAHQGGHLEPQAGHHHENHVLHLATDETACVRSAAIMLAPVPVLSSHLAEIKFPAGSGWKTTNLQPRPPPQLKGEMVCLRTTVLVV